jgi:hypothetical protein
MHQLEYNKQIYYVHGYETNKLSYLLFLLRAPHKHHICYTYLQLCLTI